MRRRSFGDEAAIEAATDHLLRKFDPLNEQQVPPDAALAAGAAALEPAFLVAAADAAPETKTVAHFVCDGVSDHVEINDALAALPNPTPVGGKSAGPRGVVRLSEGTFNGDDNDVTLPGGTALLGGGTGTLLYDMRFLLNQECELGNFGYTEVNARAGTEAIVDANGSPNELLIHDIHVYQMLSPTSGFIDMSGSGSGGRIWNNIVDVGLFVTAMELNGAFTVWDNRLVDFDIGIQISNGDCYVYDNDLDTMATGIKITTSFADVAIGPNVYRDVDTPFVDADTDVVETRFTDIHTATWSLPGAATINTGVQRLYFPDRSFIVAARLTADTAGTGSGFNILDVHKNGTTIFTTQANRPTLAAGENDGGSSGPDVRDIVAGEYLTIDIDALTATTPAADLVALVRFVELPAT